MNFELDDAALVLRVLELGTLSAAARERDVPVSQISRNLARLEAACGVRLLRRTTHGLSLTDAGDIFVAHARQLLQTREVLEADLGQQRDGPHGWVRVAVSPALASALIAPSLPGLYAKHPGVQMDLCADDRMVDMAREGIDIAIRTGTLRGDSLVALQIGAYGRTLCASPDYLARYGQPKTVADLSQHRLIASSVSTSLNRWPLVKEMGARHSNDRSKDHWQVQGHTRSDNSGTTLALVLNGVGMARLSDLVARPHLHTGALRPVLTTSFDPEPVPIYAVMLQERHRLPKLRACIDWWRDWLAHNPPDASTHS
jgi:DNA-binding transcriptional LysR family regulator